MDPQTLTICAATLLLGGILKGATGAGSPVVGVPVLAIFFGVPFAVSVFVVPNLLSNLWQGYRYRAHLPQGRFAMQFALAGACGAGIGSVMLANLPSEPLMLVVALAVLAYISFRLLRPGWQLNTAMAGRVVLPVGALAGVLQGAGGISAPVSVTFLNALRLERPVFIVTISIFFSTMSVVQIPVLFGYGILTTERFALGVLAMLPLLAGMPIGEWLARRIDRDSFDRIILALLFVIALRLVWSAVA